MGSSKRKRRRESNLGGATTEPAELKMVYVDTSLGTHLAVIVHRSDPTSEFKKKLVMEHKQCFPEVGEIQVHSVKVRRKSNYYHLPDVILVWSAFEGIENTWFLSVDVSNIPSNDKAPEHVGPDLALKDASLLLDAEKSSFTIVNFHKLLGSDGKKEDNVLESKMDSELEQDVPTMHVEGVCIDIPDSSAALMDGGGGSRDVNTDVKKKKKVKRTAKVLDTDVEQIGNGEMKNPHETIRAGENGSALGLDNDITLESKMDSELDQDVPTMHVEGVCIDIPDSSAALMDGGGGSRDVNTDVKKKKKKVKKTAKVLDTDVEQIGNGEMKNPHETIRAGAMKAGENGLSLGLDNHVTLESKMDSELDRDVATMHVAGVCIDIPDSSAALMDGGGGSRDVNTDVKKKKKKVKKTAKVLDTDVEQIGNGEMKNHHETIRAGENGLSLGLDNDVTLESKMDSELDRDVPTMHVEGVCIDIPDSSAALMDGGGGSRDVNTDVKKKKKKFKKIAKVLDTDVEQIGNGEMKNPHETIRAGENGLSLGLDNDVTPDSKAPDHVHQDLAMKEASIIRDADDVMEPQISLDWPSSSDNHIPKGTGKEESIGLNDRKDVEMILLDASNHDAQEKIRDVNSKEADLVETQTEQTFEDVTVINKMMTEKTICSAGDCRAETENTIVESNQTEKDNKNTDNRHTKSKKKTKRRCNTTDVQDKLPAEDQKVGSELLATKQTSIVANSELDNRYVDSSEVLSRKSEEKVDEKHELVLNTDGNSGKNDEGINFKSYFVADQLQNRVDSNDKVRKTTRSTRSSAKAKIKDLPSVNTTTELENSVKSLEYKKPENNSDGNEMSPDSLKISSKTTEKEVKHSSSELGTVASVKNDDIVNGSSFQKKIPSLDNSSSERSQALHNNVGNERPLLGQNTTSMIAMKTPKKKISLAKSGAISNRGKERPMLGQNATNLLLMKTPKKRISLAKSGAIFQDNSGESSGDENGTMHSDDSTHSPSDSSSTVGDSAGESELSQNSVNNGCNDAVGKSSSKFDLSATEDLTMDVILRSSKRFKKAKQVASQNETEPIEFLPDSQIS